MDNKKKRKIGKFLSYILRHNPGKIGIQLDKHGWANIEEVLKGIPDLTIQELREIVDTNSKKRYTIKETTYQIRANQGHSIPVDLELIAMQPPEYLYHGTAEKYMKSIFKQGLLKGTRQHVHLSADKETARKVGARHGKPVIYNIAAVEMFKEGYKFFISANGVWLTDAVPIKFMRLLED